MATEAGGMHPTRMLSCFANIFIKDCYWIKTNLVTNNIDFCLCDETTVVNVEGSVHLICENQEK